MLGYRQTWVQIRICGSEAQIQFNFSKLTIPDQVPETRYVETPGSVVFSDQDPG